MKGSEFTRYSLEHLPEEDLLLLIETFATRRKDYAHIADLVRGDVRTLEQMLDSDALLERLIQRAEHLIRISPYFFFLVLLRKIFRDVARDPGVLDDLEAAEQQRPYPLPRRRIERLFGDRDVLNYLANMLAVFTTSARLVRIMPEDEAPVHYIVDMIAQAQHADSERVFHIHCHIGNYTLFLTGMFPEHIEARHRYARRPLGLNDYVEFGRTFYGLASDHRLARRHHLDETLDKLSSGFEAVRRTLTVLNTRYLRRSAAQQ